MKPRVLLLIDWYLPGEKSGGPVRTVEALLHHLGDTVEFYVVTRDRDFGDREPYPDVPTGRFIECAGGWCNYLRPAELNPVTMCRLLRVVPHDVLYIHSLFSGSFSIGPLLAHRLGVAKASRVVVGPHGQLQPGALAIKRRKKGAFLSTARALGLYRGVTWQATHADEEREIREWFGDDAAIFTVADVFIPPERSPVTQVLDDGVVRIVFLSRIAEKKNLDGAIGILQGVEEEVEFDIYGPLEDERYWRRCSSLISELPANVRARYRGAVAHDRVHDVFRQYDLFLLPTHGENFGHVIAEAMMAGCCPLVSDRTPWRGLEAAGVGWDLPVHEYPAFRRAIAQYRTERATTRKARKERIMRWIAEQTDPTPALERYIELLSPT